MNEKQAKAAFLKQVKPMTKRYDTEKKRKKLSNRYGSLRQTSEFTARVVQGNKYPEFVGSYRDKQRGEMSMVVPILFTLTDEFKPGVKITSDAQFSRLISLAEGA